MSAPIVRLLAEDLWTEGFLKELFRKEVKDGLVQTGSWQTASAALGVAFRSLLEHPERPVALVINSGTDDPAEIEEQRSAVHRMLSPFDPASWHLSMAIPSIETWARADPRIDEGTKDKPAFEHRSFLLGFAQLQGDLDRAAIRAKYPEFNDLVEFVERHAPVSQPIA